MKVLALIENTDHVCYRYRLNAFAWALAQEGLLLEALPLGGGLRRISALLAARRAAIVVLQRKLLPWWQLAILRRAAPRLVYDVDDALFRRDSFAGKQHHSPGRLARFRGIVRAADAVLAGNEYLAQFALALARSSQVCCLPTCLEPSWYAVAGHRRSGSAARLTWIGQRSMLPSITAMDEQLTAVGRRLPGASLRVISDDLPKACGIKTELRPWSSAAEARELADADIGVSWLCDDLWAPGKCGLKVLQYMAAGLPVVANSVGIHRKLVVHGRSGFLADSPQEWAEAVSRLAENPSLRRSMGAAGRQRVEAEYNAQHWGPALARLLRQLADKPLGGWPEPQGLNSRRSRRRVGQDCVASAGPP